MIYISSNFSEFSTHEVTFQMDKEFHVPFDRDSHIKHHCTRPQYNVIECTTHEPRKNWNLRTRMIFTPNGMIDEKTNLKENVSTNKTYVRVKDDQNEDISEELDNIRDYDETTPNAPWEYWE